VNVPRINRLPDEVSGKIAAGEVIERPASVVKELIENSIDAEASSIAIEIVDGGKSLIRVVDDGIGVPYEDLPLMVENFSTSKIKGIEDISRIETLGFRGEALASIKTVSLLTIRSKVREADIGREVTWNGGEVVSDEPCQMNPGTDITVRDLFMNFPARRKFLGSGSSEARRIHSLINAFALSCPSISFKLTDGGRDIFNLPAKELGERVEDILGPEVFDALRFFEYESSGIKVSGYASLPDYTRGNRSLQFSFVNGRFIRNRLIYHAVQQAYVSTIPHDRYPVVVLYIDVPPDSVDVNVHPSKAEIKFRNEAVVHRVLVHALRVAIGTGGQVEGRSEQEFYRGIVPPSWQGRTGVGDAGGDEADTGEESQGSLPLGFESRDLGFSSVAESPAPLFGDDNQPVSHSAQLYWQLHNSYILIQIRSGMVIVDQHAAHERVLYDRAVKNLSDGKAVIQSLLFPATIDLTPEEYTTYEELSEVLPAIGFDIEPFGLRTILVRGIPSGVKNWEEGKLLQEILSAHSEGSRRFAVEDFLKNYACKSAIKAGMKLSIEEMQSLVDSLFATSFPFTCPHGRPTILRVSLAELEKRFHRTVKS